jgi:hypothetical protein
MPNNNLPKSQCKSLNKHDLKHIVINFLTFNIPVFVLTFLTAQTHNLGIRESLLTASVSFFTTLVDTLKKFYDGEENNCKPTNTVSK